MVAMLARPFWRDYHFQGEGREPMATPESPERASRSAPCSSSGCSGRYITPTGMSSITAAAGPHRHLDTLTVHVEGGEPHSSEESRRRAARELEHQVKSYVGISVKVEVHLPGSIERSVGKAKRVTDLRGHEGKEQR